MTLAELQQLKDAASRANATYDAARKAYKAQQKTKARAQGLTNSGTSNHLHALRAG